MFAPGPSCCSRSWWQKRCSIQTCQEAHSQVQLRFPWQAVLGCAQNSDLATLRSGQFPSEEIVVRSFSEQFCESKAFEFESGENLSVAMRSGFRTIVFQCVAVSCHFVCFVSEVQRTKQTEKKKGSKVTKGFSGSKKFRCWSCISSCLSERFGSLHIF